MRTTIHRTLAIFRTLTPAALGALSACAADDNWPAWRGPSSDGIPPSGANPPLRWDANTNIQWKAELPGGGSATPVVWGDRVFVVAEAKSDRLIEMLANAFAVELLAPIRSDPSLNPTVL